MASFDIVSYVNCDSLDRHLIRFQGVEDNNNKIYLTLVDVYSHFFANSNVTLNMINHDISKNKYPKIFACDSIMQVLKFVGLIQKKTSHLVMMDVLNVSFILKTLATPETYSCYVRNFVNKPFVNELRHLDECRNIIQLNTLDVVHFPDTPLEMKCEFSEEMLNISSYTLKKVEIESDPKYFRIKNILTHFTTWLEADINLKRESGKVLKLTAKDICDRVLRYAGFAINVLGCGCDLRALCNGVIFTKFILFVRQRVEQSGNNSYIITLLNAFQKLISYFAGNDVVRHEGLMKLHADVKTFKQQLQSSSVVVKMDTGLLVAQGLSIPFEDLIVHVDNYVQGVLTRCADPFSHTLELANTVMDCVIATILTIFPQHRAASIMNLQINPDENFIYRRSGNYLFLSQHTRKWEFVIHEHKNEKHYACPTVDIPSNSKLVQLLDHYTWASELVMLHHDIPQLEETNGCAFLNTKGEPFNSSSWYSKLITLFRVITGIPTLKMASSVLRHMVADTDLYAEADLNTRHDLARLAGHTLETEVFKYKSPLNAFKASKAAQFAVDTQLKHISKATTTTVVKEEPIEIFDKTPPVSIMTISSTSNDTSGFNTKKKLKVETVASTPKKGAQVTPVEFYVMTRSEKRALYQSIYGKEMRSGQMNWVFSKLTGRPASEYTPSARLT